MIMSNPARSDVPPVRSATRHAVQCACGHRVFDGLVIKSRVVRLLPAGGAEAKCRCRAWVRVPLTYQDA